MTKFARSALGALFAFTLLFAFAACDSGGSDGSDNSGPNWTGDWEVTSQFGEDQDAKDARIFWSLSEDELTVTAKEVDRPESDCSINTVEVVGVDDNTITVRNPEDEIAEFLLETAGNELTVTVVEPFGGQGFEPGGEIRLESVDSDPREILGCEGSP